LCRDQGAFGAVRLLGRTALYSLILSHYPTHNRFALLLEIL
jgi:hypothetical protein